MCPGSDKRVAREAVAREDWQSEATAGRLDAVTGQEPADEKGVPLAYAGDYHAKDRTEHERRIMGWKELSVDAGLVLLTSLFANTTSLALAVLYLNKFGIDPFGIIEKLGHDPMFAFGAALCAAALASIGYGYTSKIVKDRYYGRENRKRASEWKCQPEKFLSQSREREEYVLGCINAALGTTYAFGMFLAELRWGCTQLYFNVDDYGLVWYLLSVPAVFLWINFYAYVLHRIMHLPALYPHLHKWHHKFQPPTPASAIAQHPVEWTCFVMGGQAYFWVVPCHVSIAVILGGYTIYELILDHSGVMMTSPWPWQPTTKFHDDHHRYFHCNFGQHTMAFDHLFGTTRVISRKYSEKVFGGKGETASAPATTRPASPITASPRAKFTAGLKTEVTKRSGAAR
eukprot:Hpha_TRINITY_DN15705_c2_g19::TRINITY_DN15705_c2_g19_i1::g.42128::m.42128/K00227/SC5DL, ERG3; Delta7-sterol 5-desaturase